MGYYLSRPGGIRVPGPSGHSQSILCARHTASHLMDCVLLQAPQFFGQRHVIGVGLMIRRTPGSSRARSASRHSTHGGQVGAAPHDLAFPGQRQQGLDGRDLGGTQGSADLRFAGVPTSQRLRLAGILVDAQQVGRRFAANIVQPPNALVAGIGDLGWRIGQFEAGFQAPSLSTATSL